MLALIIIGANFKKFIISWWQKKKQIYAILFAILLYVLKNVYNTVCGANLLFYYVLFSKLGETL